MGKPKYELRSVGTFEQNVRDHLVPRTTKGKWRGGRQYEADKATRSGLFRVLSESEFYRFVTKSTPDGTIVRIEGGATRMSEFVVAFCLVPGATPFAATRDDIVSGSVTAAFWHAELTGMAWEMTRNSAVLLLCRALGRPRLR